MSALPWRFRSDGGVALAKLKQKGGFDTEDHLAFVREDARVDLAFLLKAVNEVGCVGPKTGEDVRDEGECRLSRFVGNSESRARHGIPDGPHVFATFVNHRKGIPGFQARP